MSSSEPCGSPIQHLLRTLHLNSQMENPWRFVLFLFFSTFHPCNNFYSQQLAGYLISWICLRHLEQNNKQQLMQWKTIHKSTLVQRTQGISLKRQDQNFFFFSPVAGCLTGSNAHLSRITSLQGLATSGGNGCR